MGKARWGVIGAGYIAVRRTIPSILKSVHAELVAVMRTDPQKLAEVKEAFQVPKAHSAIQGQN